MKSKAFYRTKLAVAIGMQAEFMARPYNPNITATQVSRRCAKSWPLFYDSLVIGSPEWVEYARSKLLATNTSKIS